MEMIKLEGVDMSEVEEEFDKILENHVAHHQRAPRMELDNNNFSQKFVEKWKSRSVGIPSMDCVIK